jgi:hypothetical protein
VSVHAALNVATVLVLVGAAFYLTLLPYTTWGDDE